MKALPVKVLRMSPRRTADVSDVSSRVSARSAVSNGSGPIRAPGSRRRRVPRPPRIFSYFDAVVRNGSIRKAAETLNIASSALNRRILDLEQEVGTALFERLPRGVRLTAAGELFSAYVRRSIRELDIVSSQIEQLRGLVRGQIGVGAVESVADELLPAAMAQFQATRPRVAFRVTIGVPRDLAVALLGDQVDLALTHDTTPNRGVTVVARARQSLCAIVRRDHQVASRTELRLADCRDFPVALGDTSLAGRGLIEEALSQSSFRLEPELVSNSVEVMRSFARLRDGICFQFGRSERTELADGAMVAIPLIDAPLTRAQLLLVIRRNRNLPAAAAAFVEELTAQLESRFGAAAP